MQPHYTNRQPLEGMLERSSCFQTHTGTVGGVPKSDFLALVWYLTAGFMCFAEEWPPSPPSLETLSSSEKKAASEMATMLATMQRLHQIVSPDCGEYFVKETWVGFIYPNRNNMLVHELAGTYKTLSSCRSNSQKKIKENGWGNADYECGVKCRREDSGVFGGINICEKTLR